MGNSEYALIRDGIMEIYKIEITEEHRSIEPTRNTLHTPLKYSPYQQSTTTLFRTLDQADTYLIKQANELYNDDYVKVDSENLGCQWLGVKIEHGKNGKIDVTYITIYLDEVEVNW